MTRIGFIGTENSHTDHFIRFLNQEERHPGFRASALAGGRSERNAALAEAGGIEVIVDEPTDLIGQVDAVIISTRDGALHRAQAEPLLAAGIPVLVDKPLATTGDDADAIIAAAEAAGTVLFSASALRFLPEIEELRATDGALGHLHISGAGDPESVYSGLFFYGIHHVEAAMEILGDPPVADALEVSVRRTGDTTVATVELGGTPVTFTFVAPGEGAPTPFHATGVYAGDVRARTLALDPDYNAPALARFIGALESGQWPADADKLRDPIRVLAAIVAALPQAALPQAALPQAEEN